MLDTHQPPFRRILHAWLSDGQVDERQPVMLVVIGEERHRRVLMLYARMKHVLVPGEHLFESASPIDDVRKTRGSMLRHGNPSKTSRPSV
jgi:hypothetical protein